MLVGYLITLIYILILFYITKYLANNHDVAKLQIS